MVVQLLLSLWTAVVQVLFLTSRHECVSFKEEENAVTTHDIRTMNPPPSTRPFIQPKMKAVSLLERGYTTFMTNGAKYIRLPTIRGFGGSVAPVIAHSQFHFGEGVYSNKTNLFATAWFSHRKKVSHFPFRERVYPNNQVCIAKTNFFQEKWKNEEKWRCCWFFYHIKNVSTI